MDSFRELKRRTTEVLQSLPQSLPSVSMPSIPGVSGHSGDHQHQHQHAFTMKGTWEKIQVPPLPRSSHSVDVIAGTAYIFGGEDASSRNPGKPVDNDMHAVALPSSGAQADYYAIKAKAASSIRKNKKKAESVTKPEIVTTTADEAEEGSEEGSEETTSKEDKGKAPATGLEPESAPEEDAKADDDSDAVPAPRIGHATAVIGHRIFMFGGTADASSPTPLDEGGRVWVFDTRTHLWSSLEPVSPMPGQKPVIPAPRSHHAAVATDKPSEFNKAKPHQQHRYQQRQRKQSAGGGNGPIPGAVLAHADSWREWAKGDMDEMGTPQRPIVGTVAERATDLDSEGYGTFIVHGGYTAPDNQPTADVWAFDVHSRVWQQFPDAPGKPRAGAALALSHSRLYRFGGLNDEGVEEGGQLDYLELAVDEFDDEYSAGEVSITARTGRWESLIHGKENVGYKEVDAAETPLSGDEAENSWPKPRSAASLQAVSVGGGWEYLVLMLGEREPPADKAGAAGGGGGKYWDDVWAFQVPAQGMSTAAGLADKMWAVVGKKSGEGKW